MEIQTITFPHLSVGNIFMFKGDRCTVTRMYNTGFSYSIQNSNKLGYMSFAYYMSTPSAKGRKL